MMEAKTTEITPEETPVEQTTEVTVETTTEENVTLEVASVKDELASLVPPPPSETQDFPPFPPTGTRCLKGRR
jgi:hypothetical protein